MTSTGASRIESGGPSPAACSAMGRWGSTVVDEAKRQLLAERSPAGNNVRLSAACASYET
jgi:hypothetical protein